MKVIDYAGNLRRNCIYWRALQRGETDYPQGEHERDCDLCQGAIEIERLTAEVSGLRNVADLAGEFVDEWLGEGDGVELDGLAYRMAEALARVSGKSRTGGRSWRLIC